MLSSPDEPAVLHDAFTTLADVVREWRELDRVTTTAGIKPAFVAAMNDITEKELGFETWRDFIQAAVESGVIHTERLPNGHVGVLLPEESIQVLFAADGRKRQQATVGRPDHRERSVSGVRLKADVWTTFVEWQEGHRRLWDERTSRAFMFPVDKQGIPAWEAEPGRFIAIEPIAPATQKDWMKDWVSSLSSEHRGPLLAALAPDAPLGAFRRELQVRGLAGVWRNELQRRVAEHVQQWAETNGIPWASLIDRRTFERPAPPGRRPAGVSDSAEALKREKFGPGGADSEIERLRALMHRVVDQMSLAELAAIPVRAEYLLRNQ